MKKLLLLFLCVSCVKIETYTNPSRLFHIIPEINTTFVIDTNFVYQYDSLGYHNQDSLYEDIYRNNTYYVSKRAHIDTIPVYINDKLDVLVSNKSFTSQDYNFLLDTVNVKNFYFLENYPFVKQPPELFTGMLHMNIDPEKYSWETVDDILYTEVYTEVVPASYIYVIQITIDDPNISCDSLIVSGISREKNLWTGIASTNMCNMLLDIKPKQIISNNAVYASRFISFGLPNSIQQDYSWDISETLKAYVAFKIKEVDKYIKVDITRRLLELTTGGFIYINVSVSDLKTTSPFDTNVNNWSIYEFEIEL